jgi:CysZ protein
VPVVKGFVVGIGYLGRGLRWTLSHPRQWLFGLIPALVVLVVYGAALVTLVVYLGEVARDVTPFADHWSHGARETLRLLTELSLLGVAVFLALVTFTAVVLAVGQPFYERLAERVEEEHGGAPPEVRVPFWTRVGSGVGDAVVLGGVAAGFALLFFALGFLPVVGQTVVPVLAALVSGYLLTGELTAVALGRRGLRRKARFALLRRNRAAVLGFGAATTVLFMVPLGAVLAMPGAVAGATLLARERLIVGR